MEKGEVEHCFVEMSACRGSCIEGPAIAHRKYRNDSAQQRMHDFASVFTERFFRGFGKFLNTHIGIYRQNGIGRNKETAAIQYAAGNSRDGAKRD